MTERPPPLANGYVWMAHTLMPSSKVLLLERCLHELRHELRTRDYSELGDPRHDTGIELWVHPDDEGPAGVILQELLRENS